MVKPDTDSSQDPIRRLVYYGPGLSGKTSNLLWLAEAENRLTELTVIDTAFPEDRCEFLPLIRPDGPLHLVAVPGRLARVTDRLSLLRGAHGVVFVADGRIARQDANLVLLDELGAHLAACGVSPATFPLVLQYNHRDLPDAVPADDMDRLLNGRGGPAVAACALTGDGVSATLDALLTLLPTATR